MTRFEQQLRERLDALAASGVGRRMRPMPGVGPIVEVDGEPLINLASNDYLGLSTHPRLIDAAADAARSLGVGATASRLVTGTLELHRRVEAQFASFKHAEAALLLPTGYMANLAVLTTFASAGDLVCLDKLCHASLIDAARASGAAVRTYPHRGPDRLARLLKRHRQSDPAARRLIVTDSVFSMDGDHADLPTLCHLADAHDAVLVVDEAHATGLMGARGSGLCEAQGVAGRVPIVVSTASKALGGLGGIVTGADPVIQTLVNRARPAIYTTGVPPAQAAAIGAALDVVREQPQRRQRLKSLCHRLARGLASRGWALPDPQHPGPIFPLVVGAPDRAVAFAEHLRRRGVLAIAIRPPTVAPGAARVRLTLRCDLTDPQVDQVLDALDGFAWPR